MSETFRLFSCELLESEVEYASTVKPVSRGLDRFLYLLRDRFDFCYATTMSTYIPPAPIGVNPPQVSDRQPVTPVNGGDTLVLHMQAWLAPTVPATSENSHVLFRLLDQRFAQRPMWEGKWRDGVVQVPERRDVALVEIRIPNSISARLRRGSYQWALLVADKLDDIRRTVAEGTLLLEYQTTSPQKDIPYKDLTPAYGYRQRTLGPHGIY